MGTTILSFADRVVIETLHHEHRSLQYIADYLGFSKTCIFNELHRLSGNYQATLAQRDHETKLQLHGRKLSLTDNLQRFIEERIKNQKWSVEQIAHVVGIAYKTIYNWIDQGLLAVHFLIAAFVVTELRRSVAPLVIVVQLRNGQLKLILDKPLVTLKPTLPYLVSVKVKLLRPSLNVKVG